MDSMARGMAEDGLKDVSKEFGAHSSPIPNGGTVNLMVEIKLTQTMLVKFRREVEEALLLLQASQLK